MAKLLQRSVLKQASIAFALLFVTGLAVAKDSKKNDPVYLHQKPLREKPIMERPQFERSGRVSSLRERPSFERSTRVVSTREKPQFEKVQRDPTAYDKSVIETQAIIVQEPELIEAPTEKRVRRVKSRNHLVRIPRSRY